MSRNIVLLDIFLKVFGYLTSIKIIFWQNPEWWQLEIEERVHYSVNQWQ